MSTDRDTIVENVGSIIPIERLYNLWKCRNHSIHLKGSTATLVVETRLKSSTNLVLERDYNLGGTVDESNTTESRFPGQIVYNHCLA